MCKRKKKDSVEHWGRSMGYVFPTGWQRLPELSTRMPLGSGCAPYAYSPLSVRRIHDPLPTDVIAVGADVDFRDQVCGTYPTLHFWCPRAPNTNTPYSSLVKSRIACGDLDQLNSTLDPAPVSSEKLSVIN